MKLKYNLLPLADDEKLDTVFDNSGDQSEEFPNGYYICVVLKWDEPKKLWYNSGRVAHVAKLSDLET